MIKITCPSATVARHGIHLKFWTANIEPFRWAKMSWTA